MRERVDLQSVPAIAETIQRVEARIADQGRLLVRYSGTEPLLRVMLEGRDENEIRTLAQEIVDVVKKHLSKVSVIGRLLDYPIDSITQFTFDDPPVGERQQSRDASQFAGRR